LGRPRIADLLLNGHGSNGWTQACGCGRIIADLVSARQPDIDVEGFGLDRM
jgi:D-amino-acid dehydrogenase